MYRRTALGLATALAVGAVGLTGCSGSAGPSTPHTTGGSGAAASPSPSPSSTFRATRWWSNAAGTAGTAIDSASPAAGAAELSPDKNAYCGMLEQTLAAGKSIMPGISATDPALLTSTLAFVAELQAVAPTEVHAAWKTLGDALVVLVKSGGDSTKLPQTDASAVSKAADAIAAHSKKACGLDLSATPEPAATPSK